jgi:hypothetical protein
VVGISRPRHLAQQRAERGTADSRGSLVVDFLGVYLFVELGVFSLVPSLFVRLLTSFPPPLVCRWQELEGRSRER